MKNAKYIPTLVLAITSTLATLSFADAAFAQSAQPKMVAPGLVIPSMDVENGRKLFGSKGCVVCHSINGLGGEDAPSLNAADMDPQMNPFEFAAKMWRGAEAMVMLQRDELGDVIELSGQELADITAFVHNVEEQKNFSMDDVPEEMIELMEHAETEGEDAHG
ncbi:c-type cytochrome [Maritalea sp.]|jgi:cytochrome c|uniref:c-type cytochrome n=1 Tax=Maritalea sp. TaxID=2003361 RepID=UPI0039E37A49